MLCKAVVGMLLYCFYFSLGELYLLSTIYTALHNHSSSVLLVSKLDGSITMMNNL